MTFIENFDLEDKAYKLKLVYTLGLEAKHLPV